MANIEIGYYLIEAITDLEEKVNFLLDNRNHNESQESFELYMNFITSNPNSAIIPKNARVYDPKSLKEII